jgi:hypothetical protein
MQATRASRSSIAIAVLLAVSTARLARADDKHRCIAAADEAQQDRIDGKLRAAREQLLVCGRPECPPLVRSDCERWMTEVMALLPTIVVAVRDAQGRDVAAADVSIDGVVVAKGLDGKPIEVDPGMHTLRVESSVTGQALEQQLLVREGEKGRPVTLTLQAGEQQTPSPTSPAAGNASGGTPAPIETRSPSTSASPWPWILGATGIVALAAGTALELSVDAQASSLAGECNHSCQGSRVQPLIIEQQVLGPIAFGIGAVSLGAAAYLLFFHPASPAPRSDANSAIRWDVGAAPGGAFGELTGRF